MKVLVEITEEEFKWEYKIGTSEQKGTACLTSGSFMAFASILQTCSKATDSNTREQLDKLMSEVGAKVYIQKYPEEAQELLDKVWNQEHQHIYQDDQYNQEK